ncbi:MAG TPA: alpha/beta fold hydrolase, partial [Candidatus Levybacteria bacterium]|nr:alpha/beta fold hydrolase [Candidatus Levybacteria bacterium]
MDPNINDSLRASPVSAQQPLPYRKIGIILIFVLIAVGVMIGLFLRDSQSGLIVNLPGNHSKGIGVSPTPMPYAELTIPYLRNREYSSTLHERQVYSNGSTYTSYLTSYDSDGLKINGLLTIPTTEMPEGGYPAIVFVHGYIPPAQYSTTEKYADYVDYLARNGFVVFKIDLRGHGNSQGDPSGAYFSPDYVIDTLNARAALQTSDFVNPDEVGLWGHSMAGNVVMRAMTARPEIQAGVIWAGAVYTYTDMREYG